MKIINTGNFNAQLEVDANDCFRLAQACEIASATADGMDVNWQDEIAGRSDLMMLWEAMACMFEALGTAAASTTYMLDWQGFSLQAVKSKRLAEMDDFTPWGKRDDTPPEPPAPPPPAKGNKAA